MTNKADYVRAQPQSRGHTCHWPGCTQQVPPALWGCKPHWMSLPVRLRNKIWENYRRGQEVTKAPTPGYIEAANEIQRWIQEQVRQARALESKLERAP